MASQQALHLYSSSLIGQYVLVYSYEQMQAAGRPVERFSYLYDEEVPCFDYIDHKSRQNIKVVGLSAGTYDVPYVRDGILHELRVTVRAVTATGPDNTVVISRKDTVVYEITVSVGGDDAEGSAQAVLIAFAEQAKKHVEDLIRHNLRNSKETIKKYMFDPADGGRWELLNISNKRHIDSVFLPADTKAELVNRVTAFVTPETKAEYARFNVPFKMNVLLHGLPGTGKTSCIHALASTIDSDIGIIHFSRELTDNLFTKAINTLSNLGNCRVVILEDIDSLFSDERKAHDTQRNNVTMSGLLNCLDGLARNEGILLFMTTNDRKVLKDVAFTRSCRIDLDIEFKEATTDQVFSMIQYYFPEQAAAKSKEALIRPFDLPGMTTAALQTFFFLHRNCKDVTTLGREFLKFLAVGEDVDERPSMYM